MASEARLDGYMHDEDDLSGYGRRVGERLRAIRRQKGLSLQEAEESSGHEFKASVLGAYERGERAISVPRLQRLAGFYNVPVDQLLPRDDSPFGRDRAGEPVVDLTTPRTAEARPVTIDLNRLSEMSGPAADMLARYLSMVQVQRQDFNGRMLTIRRDDLRALACILDTSVDDAGRRLDELGLCLSL
ncbi:helix-turn-helix domain-containing protein [soil metagenome]